VADGRHQGVYQEPGNGKHRGLSLAPADAAQLFALETMRDKYWHNMAARIQRCWRAYWRYKNEQATKIQRFWKNQKEGLVYARKREYGHQVLGGRKQRRRFSLLGMRKFMGDYLDVGGRSAQGELLRNAAGLSGRCYQMKEGPR
jgi:myosin-1